MVSISSTTAANGINLYTAQNSVQVKEPPKDSKTEDASKIIGITLSSLAAIGLGVLAVKKGVFKKQIQSVEKIAKSAANKIAKGGNYSKIREEATKNFSKEDKKIIKNTLSEARSAYVSKQLQQQRNVSKNIQEGLKAKGNIKNSLQGMKSATEEGVKDSVKIAKDSYSTIKNASKDASKLAKNNPTSKNTKLARTMENKRLQAKNELTHVQKQGEIRIQEINAKAEQKAANVAQYRAGQTKESIEKMQNNAVKTYNNSIKRKVVRDVNKPGYQRAFNRLIKFSPEQLTKVVNSKKSSAAEIKAAKDLLKIYQ